MCLHSSFVILMMVMYVLYYLFRESRGLIAVFTEPAEMWHLLPHYCAVCLGNPSDSGAVGKSESAFYCSTWYLFSQDLWFYFPVQSFSVDLPKSICLSIYWLSGNLSLKNLLASASSHFCPGTNQLGNYLGQQGVGRKIRWAASSHRCSASQISGI